MKSDDLSNRDPEANPDPKTLRHVSPRLHSPAAPVAPGDGTAAPPSLPEVGFAERYTLRDTIGAGGMGEVRLCEDARIGREVAMKVVLEREGGSEPGLQHRFLREARIQGQLEHPSIVPVYDLGADPSGALYFTMKRVRGLTLAEIIDRLARRDGETAAAFSRRKLLSAFSNVCLTVHFAHTRGVLHRDLKPGNIMLGDFGEVYVLDWGIAKLAGAAEPAPATSRPVRDPARRDATPETAHGEMIGTPGYMAPEQARGEVAALDGRADVYSLGAILFELLTLSPLHGDGSPHEQIASTLAGVESGAALRLPDSDLPPELEEIYRRATRLSPDDRTPSARELHLAIERFLDGDRDLERRCQLAADHSRRAADLARRAFTDANGDVARSEAMREVSRALALDAGNGDARRTLVRLLTHPPRELPKGAEEEMAISRQRTHRLGMQLGAIGYFSWILYLPLAIWMGVRSVPAVVATGLLWVAASASSFLLSRRARLSERDAFLLFLIASLAVAGTSLHFGAYIILPTLVMANTLVFMLGPARGSRAPVIVVACLTLIGPVLLEWWGILPPAYQFTGGTIVVLPRILDFPPLATTLCLLFTHLAMLISSSLLIGRLRSSLQVTERTLHLHTWQLRQLVPEDVPATPTTNEPILDCRL